MLNRTVGGTFYLGFVCGGEGGGGMLPYGHVRTHCFEGSYLSSSTTHFLFFVRKKKIAA